ncbi:probable beta-hexosaminidase fdl [Coccinella septempunctata]|uniref:probable beta-hexosaminidase fdl n=1 Tax=Coccinella septempunctata TaxID=41139 RepID=UPI001D090B68|nr:probable beta-hexosaminidase fdl [Coccinella septempunctata]
MRLRRCRIKMAVFGFFTFALIVWLCVHDVKMKTVQYEAGNDDRYLQWICEDNTCSKTSRSNKTTKPLLPLETCRKICPDVVIWPEPKHFRFVSAKNHSPFLKSKLRVDVQAPPRTTEAINKFLEIFKGYLKDNETGNDGSILKVNIQVSDKRDDVLLNLGTDESYKLNVSKSAAITVTIVSTTFFGARNGLETLSQLIWFDPYTGNHRILHDIAIEDGPTFTYRGVMVDTSRNFFPIPLLKKIVDGMSYSKLNTLHLHLTDAVSFPMKFKNLEWLADGGAYTPTMVYTEEDIEDLMQYSLVRGVRVLLEIDAPSHVSTGWHSNPRDDNLVICDQEDVLNGHLNPDNPGSLEVLKDVYKNLLRLMKNDDLFHIGGDEVNLDCWRDTKAAENETDMTVFWAGYTNLMLEKLKSANGDKLPKNIIMWSSPLTNYRYTIDELKHKDRLIVQYWFGSTNGILGQNLRIIYSTVGHWYLDCGFGPWKPSQKNGVCDPFTSWQKFYEYKPWENEFVKNLTEGGEVCLWAEQVAEESLETRIWPRAAAFAERVWSDPVRVEGDVYMRLDNFREILRFRDLEVSAIWPKWCTMNPGRCK